MKKEKQKCFLGYGARHTFTILAFFGFFNIFAMNVCLSVAIVAMVSQVGKTILQF
jgi:hypothetical protein